MMEEDNMNGFGGSGYLMLKIRAREKVIGNIGDRINPQKAPHGPYKIMRYFSDRNYPESEAHPPRLIISGVSLEFAKRHCNDPCTRGDGKRKDGWPFSWFDAFTTVKKPGRRKND